MGTIIDIAINVVASFVFGFIVGAYKGLIEPFIREHFTERVKLHPKWAGDLAFSDSGPQKIKLDISKLGNRITGQLEFLSGKNEGSEYAISGTFAYNILTFTYDPKNPISTSRGTATFKRLEDGQLLSGQFAYFSQSKDKIDTIACELRPTRS